MILCTILFIYLFNNKYNTYERTNANKMESLKRKQNTKYGTYE